MEVLGDFGKNLHLILLSKNIKIKDFANKLGISNQVIHSIIHNRKKSIDFDLLDKICFLLDVTPDTLFSKHIRL